MMTSDRLEKKYTIETTEKGLAEVEEAGGKTGDHMPTGMMQMNNQVYTEGEGMTTSDSLEENQITETKEEG